jgi:hypothetical protein
VAVDPQPLDAAMLIRRKRREEAGAPSPTAEGESAPIETQTAAPPVQAAPRSLTPQTPPAPTVIPKPPTTTGRAGEGASATITQPSEGIRMKPREAISLAVVHARVPEHIARGLKLMSVMEGRQAQNIVAEALESVLNAWNPRWREIV